jgi:hypothetical protein
LTKRKITFSDKKKIPTEKIILLKVIGFSPDSGIIVMKDTLTGKYEGIYTSTGAGVKLDDNCCLSIWSRERDTNGDQIKEIKKIYQFIEPPPEKLPSHAEDTCGCEDCKQRRIAFKILADKKEISDGR